MASLRSNCRRTEPGALLYPGKHCGKARTSWGSTGITRSHGTKRSSSRTALHLLRPEGAVVLDYAEMQTPRVVGDKPGVQSLDIPLLGGQRVRLPVLGRRGRDLDSFEFLRFLLRVREDIARQTLCEDD